MGGCLEFRPPESGIAGLRRASASPIDPIAKRRRQIPRSRAIPPIALVPTFARTQTHELQSLDVAIALRRDDARVCRLHGPRALRLRHLSRVLRSAARIWSASRWRDHDARPGLSVAATRPCGRSDAGVDAFSFIVTGVVSHTGAVATAVFFNTA
jgi:hypothetical protein